MCDPQSEMQHLLRQVCPERALEVDALLNKHGVRFIYDKSSDASDFAVWCNGTIQVPLASAVAFSAHLMAYLAIYSAACQSGGLNRPCLPSLDQLNLAFALLDWIDTFDAAPVGDRMRVIGQWPPGIPMPFSQSQSDLTTELAEHLTLMATGFILLHEIGHLERGHFKTPHRKPEQMETEADDWARRLLLDRVHEYCASYYPDRQDAVEIALRKRLLGAITGFLYLVRHEQVNGHSASHPRSFDRVVACIERQALDPNDLIWAFAATVLWIHLRRANPSTSVNQVFSTFRDCAHALLAPLATIAH